MENDVIQFEGEIQECLDTTYFGSDVSIHLSFIGFRLASVEDQAVV